MSAPGSQKIHQDDGAAAAPNGLQQLKIDSGLSKGKVGPNAEDIRLRTPDEEGRIALLTTDLRGRLGYDWTAATKWRILTAIFLVQVSMNLNTTLYSNAITRIGEHYSVPRSDVLWGGAASFLLAYAFGCELWAPWSEEFGRLWVLQCSLGLVNVWGLLVGFAPNFPLHVLGRVLGGLSTAGGSVTLAVITDLFDSKDKNYQHATLYIVLSSVGGSLLGPIFGGFVETYLDWQWCIWIQIIVGVATQTLHFFLVPETRATVLMDHEAKRMRKRGEYNNVYGPGEIKQIDWKEIGVVMLRPFSMFFTEPIVLALSLLSGFSDALIFMMIQSFSLVYAQWHFDAIQLGLTFISVGLGYLIAYFSFFPAIRRNINWQRLRPDDEHAQYEDRLWWLLWTVPLLPIGLLLFALTATLATPPVHWIGSMFASCMIGIANFAIYMATIDYVLRAYGPYAASATGGNGWARDFLAGILTPLGVPMYQGLGLFNATMMLFAFAVVFCAAVYVVYRYGPQLRHSSPWAQTLKNAEESGKGPVAYLPRQQQPRSRGPSRTQSAAASQRNSLELRPVHPARQTHPPHPLRQTIVEDGE